jgi:hypothetical protein
MDRKKRTCLESTYSGRIVIVNAECSPRSDGAKESFEITIL